MAKCENALIINPLCLVTTITVVLLYRALALMVHAASYNKSVELRAPNICTYDHKPVDSTDKTDDSGLQTSKSHLDRSLVR